VTTTLLVDLDGTITDPAPGILAAFRHAVLTLRGSAPPAEDLAWVIGPPLRVSFPRVLPASADIEEALRLYRAHYTAGGLFDATLHEGIDAALATLRAAGHRLYVCTSKPIAYTPPILEHFGVARHFHGMYGAELDGTRDDKGDLIAWMIAREGIDPARAVMIGDRKHDVLGAKRHGIPCVGVLWGYGGRAELEEHGAAALANHASELPGLVDGLLART
jgi:phosphoglycolate phosphatase